MSVTAQVIQFPNRELESKLARYMELKELQSEYNKLKKELAEEFKGKSEVWVGDYKVTGKEVQRKGYEVNAFSYWDWSVGV